MGKNRNKYLLKNTAVFAIGNFASKFISFFLVPLYTNALIAAEYGTADLLYTLCNFLVPLFTLNIVEGVLRFSLDKYANEKNIVRVACQMLIPLMVIGLISVPIVSLFDNFRDYVWHFYAYMISVGVSNIFLIILKGQEKLKEYAFGNVLHTILITALNLIFLLWLKMGISGYFLAYIIANILTAAYALWKANIANLLRGTSFDKSLFKKMASYSVVLIPTSFMWWIMNFLDRAMITGMVGPADSGIYAISYKLPSILTTVSSVFMQAWLFSAVKNKDDEDNTEYTNRIFNALSFVIIGVSLLMVVFTKQIFSVYVAPEYYVAWECVPCLMVGHIFLTLSTFISTSYNVNKDSRGFLKSASIGAVVNLVLNAILIPLLGMQGAAIATTISYMSVFTYRLINTRKYVKIQLTPRFLLSVFSILPVCIAIYADGWVVSVISGICLICFAIINYQYFMKTFGAIRVILERCSTVIGKHAKRRAKRASNTI